VNVNCYVSGWKKEGFIEIKEFLKLLKSLADKKQIINHSIYDELKKRIIGKDEKTIKNIPNKNV